MTDLPEPYRSLILDTPDPGEAYRRCLELRPDPDLTRTVVYGCEVRFALQALTAEPPPLRNFGDLDGRGDALLWRVLDPLPRKRVAFLGSGPYPVTALLVRQRHPDSEVTCIENDLVGFLLGRAVLAQLAPEVATLLADAHRLDLRAHDAIVVAAMVNDRTRLARRLLEETEAQVIVRGDLDLAHPRLHTVGSAFAEDGRLR